MLITLEMLNQQKNSHGHFGKKQRVLINNRYRVPILSMVGKDVDESLWTTFCKLSRKEIIDNKQEVKSLISKQKKEKKVLNAVSVNTKDDWSWKPENKDLPAIKIKPSKKNKNRGRNKKARIRITKQDNDSFYLSREWRELRLRVLEKYECKCMMCGRNPKDHGIVIHVDHIKPRSKFPDLSLTFDNLQLLCADCNLGKSNKYQTDWRPEDDFSEELDLMALANSPI